KHEADPAPDGPRLEEVRAAERREEVVEGDLVRQVGDLEAGGDLLPLLRMEQVIGAETEVEDMTRLHPVRIVIVILLAALRQGDQLGRDRNLARRNRV